MNMISRKLIVVLLAVMLFTSACGQGNVSSAEPESLINAPETSEGVDQPVESQQGDSDSIQSEADVITGQDDAEIRTFDASTIEITLDENFVTKESIGAEGGSFSVTDANGTLYTLIIPEGALLYDEEITMTPIANVNGEVISEVFQAGVKLEPEGLRFLELVSIEISNDDIKEEAVGFTTQSGGDNFHLIPSTSGEGMLTITTTHFTEFGVSREIVEGIKELSNLIGESEFEHELAKGDTERIMDTLEQMIEVVIVKSENGISDHNWESWTSEMISLILRIDEVAEKNKWNASTPGFTELMNELQGLVDLWFGNSDEIMQEFEERCIQGSIDSLMLSSQIAQVGYWLVDELKLGESKNDQMEKWRKILVNCFNWGVIWQANVVTTGDGFFSDISLGAERNVSDDTPDETDSTTLEVEYINGFWHDSCVPQEGEIFLTVDFDAYNNNLGVSSSKRINNFKVEVYVQEPVIIDCSQGFTMSADAQKYFHQVALDRINKDRFWVFDLDFMPGGGVIAQFEEGPISINWEQGKYEIWQLVTLYNATLTD